MVSEGEGLLNVNNLDFLVAYEDYEGPSTSSAAEALSMSTTKTEIIDKVEEKMDTVEEGEGNNEEKQQKVEE
jgi:hypothetical protein